MNSFAIESSRAALTGYGLLRVTAAPVGGTNEVKTWVMGGTITGGGVRFTSVGRSAVVLYTVLNDATALTATNAVKAAIEGMFGYNGTVTVVRSGSTGAFSFAVTFGGASARKDIAVWGTESTLTGTDPTFIVTTTTNGVAATWRGAPRGATVLDTVSGIRYENTSATPFSPTWTRRAGGVAASIDALGATTDLTATAASFADLAAARASVNTLRGDAEARLDAAEARLDAVIAALKSAGLML